MKLILSDKKDIAENTKAIWFQPEKPLRFTTSAHGSREIARSSLDDHEMGGAEDRGQVGVAARKLHPMAMRNGMFVIAAAGPAAPLILRNLPCASFVVPGCGELLTPARCRDPFRESRAARETNRVCAGPLMQLHDEIHEPVHVAILKTSARGQSTSLIGSFRRSSAVSDLPLGARCCASLSLIPVRRATIQQRSTQHVGPPDRRSPVDQPVGLRRRRLNSVSNQFSRRGFRFRRAPGSCSLAR